MRDRQISVEEWAALAKRGIVVPVKIVLHGYSMHPLIRYKRDPIRIIPVNRPLLRGDIVLFARSDNEYVVHRITKIRQNKIQTLGDGCLRTDAWMDEKCVLGIVTDVYRDGTAWHVDSGAARLLGRCWSALLPVRNVYRSVVRRLRCR